MQPPRWKEQALRLQSNYNNVAVKKKIPQKEETTKRRRCFACNKLAHISKDCRVKLKKITNRKRFNKSELAYADTDEEDFRQRPKIRIELPGVQMYALVDTGASMTCLRSDFARTVLQTQGRPYALMKHGVPLISVTGNSMMTEGEIKLYKDV